MCNLRIIDSSFMLRLAMNILISLNNALNVCVCVCTRACVGVCTLCRGVCMEVRGQLVQVCPSTIKVLGNEFGLSGLAASHPSQVSLLDEFIFKLKRVIHNLNICFLFCKI